MKTCNPWHPFPQAKVGRVPVGSARSGRKRFYGKIILAGGSGIFP
ncbi:hypothetical protein [Muribaculum intestinale]|nr:hypothetical protein [Muribaculum intestinale]